MTKDRIFLFYQRYEMSDLTSQYTEQNTIKKWLAWDERVGPTCSVGVIFLRKSKQVESERRILLVGANGSAFTRWVTNSEDRLCTAIKWARI